MHFKIFSGFSGRVVLKQNCGEGESGSEAGLTLPKGQSSGRTSPPPGSCRTIWGDFVAGWEKRGRHKRSEARNVDLACPLFPRFGSDFFWGVIYTSRPILVERAEALTETQLVPIFVLGKNVEIWT